MTDGHTRSITPVAASLAATKTCIAFMRFPFGGGCIQDILRSAQDVPD